jgi:hypothetical protein
VHFFLDTDGKSIEQLTVSPISGDLSPPPDLTALSDEACNMMVAADSPVSSRWTRMGEG